VKEKASFFSRFFLKILEIVGAAVATAVSGYLVAHMGGFLPSQNQPTPPAEVVALPSERPAPKSVPPNPAPSQNATAQPVQTATVPPLPEARPTSSPADQTGSSVVHKTAKAPPARKSGKPETAATEPSRPAAEAKPPRDSIEAKLREAAEAKSREAAEAKSREAAEAKVRDAAETKPREAAEAKARETADSKPREAAEDKAVEAQVRAALANVDASHPIPADVPPRRGESQTGTGPARPGETSPMATTVPARPLELPSNASNAGQPRSADLGTAGQQGTAPSPSSTSQPAATAAPGQPQQPEALTTVEIKSRPVATIETQRPPESAPVPEERNVFSALKHILPDFSRPASSDETPRPPASVGD
jgi:hypothetical protein